MTTSFTYYLSHLETKKKKNKIKPTPLHRMPPYATSHVVSNIGFVSVFEASTNLYISFSVFNRPSQRCHLSTKPHSMWLHHCPCCFSCRLRQRCAYNLLHFFSSLSLSLNNLVNLMLFAPITCMYIF